MRTCRESSIRSEFVVAFKGERMLKILVVVVINLEISGSWATELKVAWNCWRAESTSSRREEPEPMFLDFSRSSWIV